MRKLLSVLKLVTTLSFCALAMNACQTGAGSYSPVAGNERGSAPTNEKEVSEYKQAVLKCYKTGGTRVVKIDGNLRCFN